MLIASRSIRSRVRSVVMSATVDPAKGQVTLDGRLVIVAGPEGLERIPIWIESPPGSALALQFEDRGGGAVPRRCARGACSRGHSGCPRVGRRLRWQFEIVGQRQKTIHFHAEYPWAPGSAVPILAVARKYLQQGVLVVKTPHAVRSQFKATGMRMLEASAVSTGGRDEVAELQGVGRAARGGDDGPDVHAFAFNEPGARLELVTEMLARVQEAGVVREAVLATSIDPNGAAVHRLRLFLHCGQARSLELKLAAATSLVRVRRDGTDVAPIESGSGVSIPLPEASQGAKFCTIVLDYVGVGEAGLASGQMRAVLPVVSFPCLSFTWELAVPGGYEAVDCGPGLLAAQNEPAAGFGWRRRRAMENGVGAIARCVASRSRSDDRVT